ncbi:hypothetical protein TRVL_05546 [Trypanosoma vivax]|nr:hypothetical protein TRVL_05546 [Trypanosoma vivax]
MLRLRTSRVEIATLRLRAALCLHVLFQPSAHALEHVHGELTLFGTPYPLILSFSLSAFRHGPSGPHGSVVFRPCSFFSLFFRRLLFSIFTSTPPKTSRNATHSCFTPFSPSTCIMARFVSPFSVFLLQAKLGSLSFPIPPTLVKSGEKTRRFIIWPFDKHVHAFFLLMFSFLKHSFNAIPQQRLLPLVAASSSRRKNSERRQKELPFLLTYASE